MYITNIATSKCPASKITLKTHIRLNNDVPLLKDLIYEF